MSERSTASSRHASGEPEQGARPGRETGAAAAQANRVDVVSRDGLRDCPRWRCAFAAQHKDRRYYEIAEDTLHPEFDYLQPFFIRIFSPKFIPVSSP
jgi:hypothetical protein